MQSRRNKGKLWRQLRDYGIITIAMLLGVIGLNLFLLPNEITTGGIIGVASIVYWGTGIPVQETFFVINAVLLLVALKVLGWHFCAKTVYGVVVFTVASAVLQRVMPPDLHLLADQKFMACMVGAVFLGTSVGLGLSAGGSTGGSDVIAAMVHKYRDVSRPYHTLLRPYDHHLIIRCPSRLGEGSLRLCAAVCHLLRCRPHRQLPTPERAVLHHLRQISGDR